MCGKFNWLWCSYVDLFLFFIGLYFVVDEGSVCKISLVVYEKSFGWVG